MAEKIFFPNSEQFDKMNVNLEKIAKAVGSQVDISTWAGVQKAVRAGIAPDILPIGTQLKVNHSVYGEHLFDVVAHDYLKNVHDPDAHTMTIMQHDLLPTVQFDANEALYYAETELAAGTYNFTIKSYNKWDAGTYNFTLTSPVPAGGQIALINPNAYSTAITATKVGTYSSRTSTSPIETVPITAGSDGTSLGTCGEGSLNHTRRIASGSNNYKESAVRQFLGSGAAAGHVWTPQTKFDRPPSWSTTLAGYKAGLDQDFLAVVCPVTLPCAANNLYEAPDSTTAKSTKYTLTDDFYLATPNEVGVTGDFNDGSTTLAIYRGATNADRKKYVNGVASMWWLRTSNAYQTSGPSIVATNGAVTSYDAVNALNVAPACTIG